MILLFLPVDRLQSMGMQLWSGLSPWHQFESKQTHDSGYRLLCDTTSGGACFINKNGIETDLYPIFIFMVRPAGFEPAIFSSGG